MPSSPESPSLLLHRINPHHTNTNGNANANNPSSSCKQSHAPPPHYEYYTPSNLPEAAAPHHTYLVGPDQCCSAVIQEIAAPAEAVWSIVRRFDNPQAYKHFVKTCRVITGDGNSAGDLREIHVISGLPAANSTERLEILDDERHVISFSVVGGDHRLFNYRSVTSLHPSTTARGRTVVVESYIVDIPAGNTKEETSVFVDTIVKCNLQSLARLSEDLAQTYV